MSGIRAGLGATITHLHVIRTHKRAQIREQAVAQGKPCFAEREHRARRVVGIAHDDITAGIGLVTINTAGQVIHQPVYIVAPFSL